MHTQAWRGVTGTVTATWTSPLGTRWQANRVYENTGSGCRFLASVWISADTDATSASRGETGTATAILTCRCGTSAAPTGCTRTPVVHLTPVWTSADTDYTYSVAWGDWDGDGDLDLAVGNGTRPTGCTRNDGLGQPAL